MYYVVAFTDGTILDVFGMIRIGTRLEYGSSPHSDSDHKDRLVCRIGGLLKIGGGVYVLILICEVGIHQRFFYNPHPNP